MDKQKEIYNEIIKRRLLDLAKYECSQYTSDQQSKQSASLFEDEEKNPQKDANCVVQSTTVDDSDDDNEHPAEIVFYHFSKPNSLNLKKGLLLDLSYKLYKNSTPKN